MYLDKKDFDVVERGKLIFLNKGVYKKICSIEKILSIIFASFYERKEDKNLLFLFKRLNDLLSFLGEYNVCCNSNVLVLELNHVDRLDEEENYHDGFKEQFPAICRLFKDDEFKGDIFISKFEFNMNKVLDKLDNLDINPSTILQRKNKENKPILYYM